MKKTNPLTLTGAFLIIVISLWSFNVKAQYCSGTTNLTASSGSFSDGSGSNNYMDYTSCSWLIQPSTTAASITLSFSSFSTESGYDYVEVYQGTGTSGTLLGSFSGSSIPSSITATGSSMYVTFTTDGSVTYQGWNASYTSVALCTATTPTITPSGSTTFCGGGSVTLTSSSATSYLWSTGATTQSITVTQTGNYTVQITNSSGCTATSAVTTVTNNGPFPTASTDLSSVCAGGTVQLTASAGSSMQDNFDPINSSQWLSITGGVTSTSCGSVSGNALYFDGNIREAITKDMNTSGGGTINFSLKIASGTSFPCENADGGEDVLLQYSTNGGSTWTTINTYYTGNTYQNFTGISVTIPAAAQASATRFKWVQPYFSGQGTDNWALDNVSISGAGSGSYTYSWSPTTGLSDPLIYNPTAIVSSNTTYTVTVTDINNGCTNTASVSVSTFTTPQATITAGSSTTFCQGGSVTLTANTGIAYLWNTGDTTKSITVSQAGSYSVTVTYAGGCTSTSATTNVTVNTPVMPTITPSGSTTFCAGGNVTLASSSAISYLWSNGATTQSITITQSGNYTVIITDSNGCKDTSAVTTVTNNGPYVSATSNFGSVCAGGTVQLSASAGSSMQDNFDPINTSLWASISGGTANTNCGSVTGNALHFDGSSPREAITKDMNTSAGGTINFSLKIGNSFSPCETADFGEDVILYYSNNAGSTWNTINTYLTGTTYQNFTAVTVNIPSAAQTSSTRFRWAQPYNSGSGFDNWALDNVSISAGSTGNFSYSWSPVTGLSDPLIYNPTAVVSSNTTYTVTITDINTSCTNTGSVTVNTFTPATATINASGSTSFCQGDDVTLSANTGTAYSWSQGGTTQSISVNQSGTYSVTVTYAGGCTSTSAGTTITVYTPAAASVTALGPVSFCGGGDVTLAADTADSYTWSTGAITQNITVSQSGNYWVVTTDANGCKDTSSSITVTNNGPLVSAASNLTTVCTGTTIQLSSQVLSALDDNFDPLNNTLWSSITGGTVNSLCGSASGNALYFDGYTKEAVTNDLNTSAGGTINFSLKIAYSTSYPCSHTYSGNDIYLQYSTDGGFNWNYIAIYYAGYTTYQNFTSLSVTIPAAAKTSATRFKWVQPYTYGPGYDNWALDNVSISAGGTGNYTYSWQPASAVSNATISDPTALINSSSTFSVTISDVNSGCSNTASVSITANPTPTATITPGGPTSFCTGSNVILYANTGSGYTYQWKKNGSNISGATGTTYTASTSGNYSVMITKSGCSGLSSDVMVTVYSSPTATITATGATTFCQGDSVALTASQGSTYLWSTGETSQTIFVKTGGSYNVTVTNPNGCSGSATSQSVSVTVNPLPPVPTITQSGNTLISSSPTGNQWYINGTLINGATQQTIIASFQGTYSVVVTNSYGCSSSSDDIVTNISETQLVPGTFQIYPNPFSNEANITYTLNAKSKVTLEAYNLLGEKVNVYAIDEEQGSGEHSYKFTTSAQGIYFIQLKADDIVYRQKIISLK